MKRNAAKAGKRKAGDLLVKAARSDRATRVTGGGLASSEVMCQNNLRPAAKVTDGTSNTIMFGERL
jgi:hypothetical protein